jgi:hypothetical protein
MGVEARIGKKENRNAHPRIPRGWVPGTHLTLDLSATRPRPAIWILSKLEVTSCIPYFREWFYNHG